ncbi:ATP-binding cassette domain-containing protein [Isobaculum melis]|uniref:ABC-2 type transport system ATP-binding protein n=1 Tax=Isobaculum melis TaxID=142588 RepID=A0A1H9SVQ8_9LACT|nr:ABC transporter ATP-binding protein [Isobaculum melis]SER89082.1 ABC-2 type transport system ATP-binding protein [Isobaculum melis]
MSNGNELLIVEHMKKNIGSNEVLKDISFKVNKGKLVLLIGSNGAGKTTLLNIIGGQSKVLQGAVQLENHLIAENHLETNEILRRRTAYLSADLTFPTHWLISEIGKYGGALFPDFNEDSFKRFILTFQLGHNQSYQSLSLGQQMKVKLSFILAREVPLYLLDEPFTNLDLETRLDLVRLIISETSPDASFIIATHLIGEFEQICDEALMMKDGTIRAHIEIDDIREKSQQSLIEFYQEELRK